MFVSNTVHDQVRDRLPFVFEDLGEQLVEKIRIAPLLGAFCPFHPIAGERRNWAFCTSLGGK